MKKYLPYLLYMLIAAFIMRPLFAPGHLFLLDMVWGENIRLGDYFTNGINSNFPLVAILRVLNFMLSAELLQKLLLLFLLYFAGANMYGFVRSRGAGMRLAFASGLFFMLNPYVYERFLAGHWLVLLGYGFFPLALKRFLIFLDKNKPIDYLKFVLLFSIYPMLSLHWAYIAFFTTLLISLVFLWRRKEFNKLLKPSVWLYAGISLVLAAIVNSYWLSDFFSSDGILRKITLGDFNAFATSSDPSFGAFFNVLSLYGFWNDINFLPKDFISLWWLISIVIIIVSLVGWGKVYKVDKNFGIASLSIFVLALFIAVGYADPITRKITGLLYQALPGFKGLRETEKLAGLLAFFYAYFLPRGAAAIIAVFAEWKSGKKQALSENISIIIVGMIVFLISFGIFDSFNSQVKAYAYPDGWSKAEKIMTDDQQPGLTLFFPWHGYPRLDFAGNVKAANPASAYFGTRVVSGRNLDNVFLLETEQGEWDDLIFKLVQETDSHDNSLEALADKGINYIILAKIDDWERYDFLKRSDRLEKIFEDESVILFKL